MTSEAKKKIRKVAKTTSSVAWWSALVLLFFVLISIVSAKMSGKVPSVFGYSVMHIVSGSMEDEIPQGSYIVIKKISPEEVKIDDIICFYSEDPAIYGYPNTHRVVEEPIRTEAGFEFVTKGDANNEEDRVRASGDKLIGVYVKTLDGVSNFANTLSGNTLVFVFIGLQVSIIGMAMYIIVVIKKRKSDKK